MLQSLKEIFRKPTPIEIASHELADAERRLLEAHSGVEYAKAMVSYHSDRIKRLKNYLAAASENQTQ